MKTSYFNFDYLSPTGLIGFWVLFIGLIFTGIMFFYVFFRLNEDDDSYKDTKRKSLDKENQKTLLTHLEKLILKCQSTKDLIASKHSDLSEKKDQIHEFFSQEDFEIAQAIELKKTFQDMIEIISVYFDGDTKLSLEQNRLHADFNNKVIRKIDHLIHCSLKKTKESDDKKNLEEQQSIYSKIHSQISCFYFIPQATYKKLS